MQASADREDPQRRLEIAARTNFEVRSGRKLTDAEWAAMRSKLMEFVAILRDWEETTTRRRAR
jgi:hypothetical protein